jgi:hypothetical protein
VLTTARGSRQTDRATPTSDPRYAPSLSVGPPRGMKQWNVGTLRKSSVKLGWGISRSRLSFTSACGQVALLVFTRLGLILSAINVECEYSQQLNRRCPQRWMLQRSGQPGCR